jgi:hypothetical protein
LLKITLKITLRGAVRLKKFKKSGKKALDPKKNALNRFFGAHRHKKFF